MSDRVANHTMVCFACRESVRVACTTSYDSHPPCRFCKTPMQKLNYTLRIPPKKDIKGWKKLRELVIK